MERTALRKYNFAVIFVFKLATAKTFNSDFCRKVTNALYQRWVELFAIFSTSVKIVSKCYLNVLLVTAIDISFYSMVDQWMANM